MSKLKSPKITCNDRLIWSWYKRIGGGNHILTQFLHYRHQILQWPKMNSIEHILFLPTKGVVWGLHFSLYVTFNCYIIDYIQLFLETLLDSSIDMIKCGILDMSLYGVSKLLGSMTAASTRPTIFPPGLIVRHLQLTFLTPVVCGVMTWASERVLICY